MSPLLPCKNVTTPKSSERSLDFFTTYAKVIVFPGDMHIEQYAHLTYLVSFALTEKTDLPNKSQLFGLQFMYKPLINSGILKKIAQIVLLVARLALNLILK